MNAPLIWIIIPLVASVFLWFIRSRHVITILTATVLCLVMALLAHVIPIDTIIRLGADTTEVSSTLLILGRKLVISNNDKSFLLLIYLISAFWFLGSLIAGVYRRFVPLGLAITAIFVAALSVEPFLYAALLIEVAVLLSIPMLVSPERAVGQGLIRYLIFQTLALPLMLLAGWFSSSVDANPADFKMVNQTVILLSLGFIFWLAVFPFYSWVPLLSGETHPYIAGFVLSMLPVVVLLLALDFLNAYTWLREYPSLLPALRIMGVLMVVTGGIFAAFQQDLSRLFGYAVIIENGFSLLALSLGDQTGLQIMVSSFVPRILGLGVFAVSMSIMEQGRQSLAFAEINGLFKQMPLTACAIIISIFSLAGLPLLAAFPVRHALIIQLASESNILAFWVIIGNLGFLICGFRALIVLVGSKKLTWSISESWLKRIILAGGMSVLLLIGLFPGLYLPGVLQMLNNFRFLQ